MKRIALLICLLSWLSLACTAGVCAEEKVLYVDRQTGKDAEASGTIQQESAAGITIKQGASSKVIPATDIHHVTYKLGDVKVLDYNLAFNRERTAFDPKKDPVDRRAAAAEVLREYEKLADRLRDNPNAYRYLQYRIALLKVRMGREDATKRDAGFEALNTFHKENSTGWEIVPALKLLAQLQEAKGDLAGAQESYKELRILPGVPKELALESSILIANMMLRGKNFKEAEKTLQEVRASMADNDPQKAMILVYLCQAQMMQDKTQDIEKQVTTAIQSTSDAPTLALAHNTLGDYYRKKNQDEEAFWHYLRVDVLYPGDPEEHAKALYWLSKLFESVKKDKVKALEYVEKLKSKDLEGTEYARRLAAEK